jgi:hypothetical protein
MLNRSMSTMGLVLHSTNAGPEPSDWQSSLDASFQQRLAQFCNSYQPGPEFANKHLIINTIANEHLCALSFVPTRPEVQQILFVAKTPAMIFESKFKDLKGLFEPFPGFKPYLYDDFCSPKMEPIYLRSTEDLTRSVQDVRDKGLRETLVKIGKLLQEDSTTRSLAVTFEYEGDTITKAWTWLPEPIPPEPTGLFARIYKLLATIFALFCRIVQSFSPL